MFTGIIAGLGEIRTARTLGRQRRFSVVPMFSLDNITDGESIAINGVCLSVEKHHGHEFEVYASQETVSRSNLGKLKPGSKVNLERALALGDRLGGHIVSGHVDCLANVVRKKAAGASIMMRLEFPPEFAAQIVSKGSVALNGISLTINSCAANWLEVNIIPDSLKRTNISQWSSGESVNMETDLIGKYVAHMLQPWQNATNAASADILAQYGFL